MAQASANTASEPSVTPQSAPQVSPTATGSSWDVDPVLIPPNFVSSSYKDVAKTYWQHWQQIRNQFSCHNRLQDWYKSAGLPSTLPASANNWAGPFPINPPSLKSTCCLVLFCATPKRVSSSTITPLSTIIWCWNSLLWSPIKTI